MDDIANDAAAVRIPPPLLYLAAIVIGVLTDAFVTPQPIGLPLGWTLTLSSTAGLAGFLLMGLAITTFRRTGQDPKPWATTPQIISTGVYRVTRNPMYLGLALLQFAIGVGLGNGWIVILVPVVPVMIYYTAIRHEEAYLERKFGSAYTDYKKSVRRWF